MSNSEQFNRLAEIIESPESYRKIVGGYDGFVSLGITETVDGELALHLAVQDKDNWVFPDRITTKDTSVRIITERGVNIPEAL